jgi:hypothetical protein
MAGVPIQELGRMRADALASAVDVDANADQVAAQYQHELDRTRRALYDFVASEPVRHALLLSAPGLEVRTPHPGAELPPRNSDCRRHEHSWALYLQRLAAKNDTISAFGPSAWGEVDLDEERAVAIELDDDGGAIAERTVFIERWVCEALVELMARDRGEDVALPVTATPFERLRVQLATWPADETRARWEERLAAIERLRSRFETASLDGRRETLAALTRLLEEIGVATGRRARALYAARLPINEDCRRRVKRVVVGAPFVEQATRDLAPWYEMWRDLAALYATRIGAVLRPIWRSLADEGRPVSLARFFDACRVRRVDFWRHGGTGMVPELDGEIQTAWTEQLGDRARLREVELSEDDLAFVRRRFSFDRMRAFDLPAPDLQIVARDVEAIAAGRWQLLLGEIHPDLAIWEHCFLAWCPNLDRLTDEYRRTGHGAAVMFGPTDEFGVHILCRAHERAGDWTFVAPLSADGARTASANALFVEERDTDLVVVDESGAFRGSLLHQWRVTANTHRLELVGTGRHSPRLRVGRVIAQRESWLVTPNETLRRETAKAGLHAFAALRALRRRQGWPEEVFVRPQLPLRLTYHKDAKPIFVDFRSPLFCELLAGWIRAYPRLRISEMLPSSESCWLADTFGHRFGCELRMVAIPEEAP